MDQIFIDINKQQSDTPQSVQTPVQQKIRIESLRDVAQQLQTMETKELPFKIFSQADLNSSFTLEVVRSNFFKKNQIFECVSTLLRFRT